MLKYLLIASTISAGLLTLENNKAAIRIEDTFSWQWRTTNVSKIFLAVPVEKLHFSGSGFPGSTRNFPGGSS